MTKNRAMRHAFHLIFLYFYGLYQKYIMELINTQEKLSILTNDLALYGFLSIELLSNIIN